jgi:hypothetical protein
MYKIKFQSGLLTNPEQTESTPVYSESSYSDSDIKEVARLWKILGNKKVASISLSGKCAMSHTEVIDLFYPEVIKHGDGSTENISDHDKGAKAQLIAAIPEEKKDEVKANRDELKAKATELGITYPKNISTPDLEKLVAEASKTE